jgi:hypothetical protein
MTVGSTQVRQPEVLTGGQNHRIRRYVRHPRIFERCSNPARSEEEPTRKKFAGAKKQSVQTRYSFAREDPESQGFETRETLEGAYPSKGQGGRFARGGHDEAEHFRLSAV